MLRAALLAVCAAVAGLVVVPGGAVAGSYEVPACSPGATPGLWAPVNTAPAGYASGNLCGGPEIGPLPAIGSGGQPLPDSSRPGSLYAEDILGSAANIPDGARAGWTLSAPSGATISRISYYRTLGSHADTDQAAGLFLANGVPLEQCRKPMQFNTPITCSKPNNQAPVVFEQLDTTSLFFGVLCDIVTQGVIACGTGGTIHRVQAYLYSARVTITENAAPTVTNVAGALWGGGVIHGTVPVTFSAADASGIREQAVQSSGGQTIISDPHDCDYTRRPPCPDSPAATLDVDTTHVPDGTQTFRLAVTDAAANSRVLTSPPVTVDNLGPPPPLGLTATAQAGSNLIAVTWSNPPNAPQPIIGAMAQLCSTSCSTPTSVNPAGSAQLTAPGPGVYSARVWLLDAAGRGGPHHAAAATVTVPPTPPPPPSSTPPRTRISAVLRGRQLRVSGPIAAGARVTVSWRSKVRGRTVGHGSRTVKIRNHRLTATFVIPRGARTRAATIRVAVRSARRVIGQARVRRG